MRIFFFALFVALICSSCNQLPHLGPGNENELASAAEDDCGYVQNSYGQRVSWKSSLPIHLHLSADFPTDYEQPLRDAAKLWEDAAGKTLFVIDRLAFGQNTSPSAYDGSNVIYWMTDWDNTQEDLQAVTSLHWYGNGITDADMRVDAKYFNYFVTFPNSTGDIHMESLLLHELGHVLGLKHKTVSPTVMWATLRGATVRETLSATDLASLKCEY